MQMFCTSLEPKTKHWQGQGADLSIMTALTWTNPGAKSLLDPGVRCKPRSETTRDMIAAIDSMLGGTIFDASRASFDDFETSEQNPFGDKCHLRSSRDPVGYSKGALDPKHHGQAMQSAMKAEWIKSQTSEMDGLWRCGVFQKVLRSSLTPQDRVFTSRFNFKIKRKGGEFDKCKVRLVVQRQHMRRKGEDSVDNYNDAFSPVPALADSAPFSVWQHNKTCSLTTLIFLRPLFRVNYCPETVTIARFIFLYHQDMTKILSTCIASLSHFTACPLQPELGTAP